MRGRKQFLLPALLGLIFSGCSVGPDYVPPKVALPAQFSNSPVSGDLDAALANLPSWWKSFNDPILDDLINRALSSNLDLKRAQARVLEARSLVSRSRSDFFPTIVSESNYSRTNPSNNARNSNVETVADGSTTGSAASNSESNGIRDLYEAGFDATWEIDIFGGTRRDVEAAQDTHQAQIEGRRDVLVTLLAEVAQNYVTLRGAQQELAITRENVAAQRETLELQRLRFNAGITNDLTVSQAEAQLQATSAQIPSLEIAIYQAIHRLSTLLARPPQAMESELLTPAGLPRGPSEIPPGLPSELLRRRPDIRRAERELAAATASIGAATADFFPKLSLTGTFGVRSENSNALSERASLFWSQGPNLTWNILSWHAILANIEIQNARQEQALLSYRSIVLQGLNEVENALVAFDREQARHTLLGESVAANRRALQLAQQLNTAGVVDFLNVLTTQQAVFQSESLLAESSRAVSGNLIALYKALGGGWEFVEERDASDATKS